MKIVEKATNRLVKKYGISQVDYAIVVGSGLINSAPELENVIVIDYDDLGLPKSKVKGHSGNFTIGTYKNKVVALVSRMHFYESGDISKVRIPLEIMAKLGAKKVVLLTSCGGINTDFSVGDVMLIDDQINMSGVNPLVGLEQIKFVDMSSPYSKEIRNTVLEFSKKNKLDLKRGIFVQMSGPSYETMAEIEMLRKLGGDAVSMSTAHDCIIAKYLDMDVVGFSVIVNVFNDNVEKLTHEEVLENAQKACKKVKAILSEIIKYH